MNSNEFPEDLLMSAVRYALGRATYIVGTTVDYTIAQLPRLSYGCLMVMKRDIDAATPIEHNRAAWGRLIMRLENEIGVRKVNEEVKPVKVKVEKVAAKDGK